MRTNDDSLSVKPRRTHVRSGCRTCKLRKVKCDEGRPACHRCVSSGRTCSGYGIWGGGGNVHTHRASSVLHKEDSTALPPAPVTLIGATKEERGLFDWFRTETRTKFPGLFVLDFWDSVVIQACQQEPAVRHAVFCLSLVHKSIVLGNKIESSANGPGNEIEQRVIYQYNKAIRNLAPHFSSKERDSTRIALIACLIFVSLEHLRGRFEAAEFHLKNGVKIFSELQAHSKSEEGGTTKLKKSSFNLTDNCIFQAFSRMNVQVELFKQTLPHSLILLPDVDHGHPVSVFSNRNEAWMYLERLMNKVFHLIQQCSQARNDDGKPPGSLDSVVKDQRRIREELEQWYATFECSRRFIIGNDVGPCICDLLHNYFVVTSIMLETALHPVVDESIYDLYTQDFLSVVEHSSGIFGRGIGPWLKLNSAISNDISKSSVDNGWVVPLYFTAIKCRVHRIRVHAIRLLESLAHREGIWDSRITSSIARRVMEYEERDFFDNHDIDDDFELTDVPELQDLTLPILPASYRIAGHKVLLQNNVNGTVSIHYQQNLVTEEWHELEVPIRKYGLFPYEKKQDLSSDSDPKIV